MSLLSFLNLEAQQINVRESTLRNKTVRVLVPPQAQLDAVYKRLVTPDERIVNEFTQKLKEENSKEADWQPSEEEKVKITQAAKTRQFIFEAFKLLCNEKGQTYPSDKLTQEAIDEAYSLPIQLEIARHVFDVISPSWEEARKN